MERAFNTILVTLLRAVRDFLLFALAADIFWHVLILLPILAGHP